MISIASPVPIGNAVSILLAPIAGTIETRVLRKITDNIADQNDPNAVVVFDCDTRISGLFFIDVSVTVDGVPTLANGTPYFYQAFDYNGSAWTVSPVVEVTPQATSGVLGPDPFSLVRQRLEDGLRVEVTNGSLVHDWGYIPCMSSPPLADNTKFPVVSIHMRSNAMSGRGIGEVSDAGAYDAGSDSWTLDEGSLDRMQIDIIGWVSGNPDTRIALRKSIMKVLKGNLDVFVQAGMVEIDISAADSEDMESYATPMYWTQFQFNCLAPNSVTEISDTVDSVTMNVIDVQEAA